MREGHVGPVAPAANRRGFGSEKPTTETIEVNRSVGEAAEYIRTHGVRRIPVLRAGTLAGIVTPLVDPEAVPLGVPTASSWIVMCPSSPSCGTSIPGRSRSRSLSAPVYPASRNESRAALLQAAGQGLGASALFIGEVERGQRQFLPAVIAAPEVFPACPVGPHQRL